MTALSQTKLVPDRNLFSKRMASATITNHSNYLKLVSLNRSFENASSLLQQQVNATNYVASNSNLHKQMHLSPTTIPTLLSSGVLEDASQFQRIINERKCEYPTQCLSLYTENKITEAIWFDECYRVDIKHFDFLWLFRGTKMGSLSFF